MPTKSVRSSHGGGDNGDDDTAVVVVLSPYHCVHVAYCIVPITLTCVYLVRRVIEMREIKKRPEMKTLQRTPCNNRAIIALGTAIAPPRGRRRSSLLCRYIYCVIMYLYYCIAAAAAAIIETIMVVYETIGVYRIFVQRFIYNPIKYNM